MTKSNSKIKRKSEKCNVSQGLNVLQHSEQRSATNSIKDIMNDPKKSSVDRSILHRSKVTSVGGESIMLILLLLPLSGNFLKWQIAI